MITHSQTRRWSNVVCGTAALALLACAEEKTPADATVADAFETKRGEVSLDLPTPELAADLQDLAAPELREAKADLAPELPDSRPPEIPPAELLPEIDGSLVPPDCGDGMCKPENGETCLNCPDDCGWCTACGNGECELGQPLENQATCPLDCGYCGDGVCSMAELNPDFYCYWDCLAQCGDGLCGPGEGDPDDELTYCLVDCSPCDDGCCGLTESLDPALADCKDKDCGTDCGNGKCDPGEGWESCPLDCGLCGDGLCGKVGGKFENCPPDCVKPCGDGLCEGSETQSSCAVDCGPCGDGVCGINEMKMLTCPADCPPECGNDECEAKESAESCPGDCACHPLCEPQWLCGEDAAGCGQPCGVCPAGTVCIEHFCCVPVCVGKACGDDGCGGSCGDCPLGQHCGDDGSCHPDDCQAACPAGYCGDDGCGKLCPPCDDGLTCTVDLCVQGQCQPSIMPLFCVLNGACVASGAINPAQPCLKCRPLVSQIEWSPAEDGITCPGGVCQAGTCCPKAANCAGLECGDDGCGGTCGTCPPGELCEAGKCEVGMCVPDCGGAVCGDDGCGGTCGSCNDGLLCTLDLCVLGDCSKMILPFFCVVSMPLIGATCIPSGMDNPTNPCQKCRPTISNTSWSAGNDGVSCGPMMKVCFEGKCCDPTVACAGKECGDNGCGGICGKCDPGKSCENGLCKAGPCVPSCAGKECGSDGCGGLCGTCDDANVCTLDTCQVGVHKCQHTPTTALCDDNNDCTDDGCEPAEAACTHAKLNDGAPCGLGGVCKAGLCAGCDDDNFDEWDGCNSDGELTEFYVSSITMYEQRYPAVAAMPDGRFVASWSYYTPESALDVRARVFSSLGLPTAKEIPVNEGKTGSQYQSSVAVASDYTFTVAWTGKGPLDPNGISARQFKSDGSPLFADVQANTNANYLTDMQANPFVTCFDGGTLPVVFFQSDAQDGNAWGIFGQPLSTVNGQPMAPGDIQMNLLATGDQQAPSATLLQDGSGIVLYHSQLIDGAGMGIAARFLNDAAIPSGTELALNQTQDGDQRYPDVALLANGNLAVVFQSNDLASTGWDIRGQVFNNKGLPQGSEFKANTHTTGDQLHPSVATLADTGGFAVSWVDKDLAGGQPGIWVRLFDATGKPAGDPFRAHKWPNGTEFDDPDSATFLEGGFVLTWALSPSPAGAKYEVFAQRFDSQGNICPVAACQTGKPPDCPATCEDENSCTEDSCDPAVGFCQHVPVAGACDDSDACTTGDLCIGGSCTGTPKKCDDVHDCTGDGCDSATGLCTHVPNHALCDDTYECTTDTCDPALGCQHANKPNSTPCALGSGVCLNGACQGAGGSCNDGNAVKWDGCTDNKWSELQANQQTALDQWRPSVATFPDGSYIVAWDSYGQDGDGPGIFARRYGPSGLALGPEFQVNAAAAGAQEIASVVTFSDQRFLVGWQHAVGFTDSEILVRAFKFDQTQDHAETVLASGAGKYYADISVAVFGDFSMALTYRGHDADGAGVQLQYLSPSWAPVGGPVVVNDKTLKDQWSPAIARFADDRFVIVWSGEDLDASQSGIAARLYNKGGAPAGLSLQVNDGKTSVQQLPAVATIGKSRFVAVWEDYFFDPEGNIYGRIFDSGGKPLGPDLFINEGWGHGVQKAPRVAATPYGEFVVSWMGEGPAGTEGMLFQRFDAEWKAVGPVVCANNYAPGANDYYVADVAFFPDGKLVLAWDMEGADGLGSLGVYHRRYKADGSDCPPGQCTVSPDPCAPGCDDGDPCTKNVCNAATGACLYPPNTCDDGNPCTNDTCAPAFGCLHYPGSEGVICDCGSECKGGTCVFTACDSIECGSDGCGGSCGTCNPGFECNAFGLCQVVGGPSCNGFCEKKPSGGSCWCDNLCFINGDCCGDVCTFCSYLAGCCEQDCAGKECGDDGCGGTCGTCELGYDCDAGGHCQPAPESCAGYCGGSPPGGTCSCEEECFLAGNCCSDLCIRCPFTPGCCDQDCTGKKCGDDGCGGSCGNCEPGFACDGWNQCVAVTYSCNGYCYGLSAGDVCSCQGTCFALGDCCSDVCMYCPSFPECCVPSCSGKECGDDGCGGQCGPCPVGQLCGSEETCEALGETCNDGNAIEWDGCTNGVPTEFRLESSGGYVGHSSISGTTTTGQTHVAWHRTEEPLGNVGILARSYSTDGIGAAPLLVHVSWDAWSHTNPDLCVLTDDDFVVAWNGSPTPVAEPEILAVRYNADDSVAKSEFTVNLVDWGADTEPVVGAYPAGGFVVLWTAQGPTDPGDIMKQIYDSAGNSLVGSPDKLAHAVADGTQGEACVSQTSYAGFNLAAFASQTVGDPNLDNVRSVKVSLAPPTEIVVNTTLAGDQLEPDAAWFNPAGTVIVWSSNGQDGNGYGVYGQRFGSDGVTKQGPEFKVNAWTAGNQFHPAVSAHGAYGFVVVWSGAGEGDQEGIYAQCYTSGGTPMGTNIRVNRKVKNNQSDPDVFLFPTGIFFVTWTDEDPAAGTSTIMGRRLKCNGDSCVSPTCKNMGGP
jgi:hypothetical protein